MITTFGIGEWTLLLSTVSFLFFLSLRHTHSNAATQPGSGPDADHPVHQIARSVDTTYGDAIDPLLTIVDLPLHTVRVFLTGRNCGDTPWCPDGSMVPHPAIDSTRWANFVHRDVIPAASWEREPFPYMIMAKCLRYLYPPLAACMFHQARLRRAVAVAEVVVRKGGSIWASSRARAMGDLFRIKFGCDSTSLTVGWLDILDLRKDDHSWKGYPTLPLLSRLGGDGSFLRPFVVDTCDPYTKAIAGLFPRDSLAASLIPGVNGLLSKQTVTNAQMSELVASLELSDLVKVSLAALQGKGPSAYSRSSYTSLRDALVESGTSEEPVETELCLLFERPSDARIPPVGASDIPILAGRISPVVVEFVGSTDAKYPLSMVTVLLRNDWIISPLENRMTRKSVTVAITLMLATSTACIGFLEAGHLNAYFEFSSVLFAVALSGPPFATELAIAVLIAWSLFGSPAWGRWAAYLLLCGIVPDIVGVLFLTVSEPRLTEALVVIGSFVLSVSLKLFSASIASQLCDFVLAHP